MTARKQQLSREQTNIKGEVEYIVRCAAEHDARVVTLGPLVFFSTETGDAWLLDPSDHLALCLARDGNPQPVNIAESAETFAIDWNVNYQISGDRFIVTDKSGQSRTIIGYPIHEIAHVNQPSREFKRGNRSEAAQQFEEPEPLPLARPIASQSKKLGRNEPCWCGSGKKYKHCHMRQGEREPRASLDTIESEASSDETMPARVARTRERAPHLLSQALPDKRQEIQHLLAQLNEVVEYQDKLDQIEASTLALEAHRTEFEALLKDWQAIADRARVLFAEECFHSMWFTAEDIQRAFETVGYPQRFKPDERMAKIMSDVILHVADKERRLQAYMQLMSLVPDYVSAERFRDAWLIQYCAFLTVDALDKSNPFLAEMFFYGFDAWAKQADAQEESLVREMGFDPAHIGQMTIDELEEWIQMQMTDPAKKAQMEVYLEARPMLRAQTEAGLMEMEGGAALLLERDDSNVLYLAPEEVEPWVPKALERMQTSKKKLMKVTRDGKPDPVATIAAADIVVSITREMAQVIFTTERVNHLVGILKDYRRKLLAANEKQAAAYAQGAIMMLERETNTAEDPFLSMICFASLRAMLQTLSEQVQARGQDKTESGEVSQ